jgi:hypothetical protein
MFRFQSQSSDLRCVRVAWLGCVVVALACGRPLDRPREGAPPAREGEAHSDAVDLPPTLVVPGASKTVSSPSPLVEPSPSPTTAVAGRNPVLSALAPAPDALVAPGAVNIGARVSGSSDIAAVVLVVDGSTVEPRLTPRDAKTWLVGYTASLDVGKHEVRLSARDRDGRVGGYRWRFEAQPARPDPVGIRPRAPQPPSTQAPPARPSTPTERFRP